MGMYEAMAEVLFGDDDDARDPQRWSRRREPMTAEQLRRDYAWQDMPPTPLAALRHHVSGAVARGEAEPIWAVEG